jgi:hypothetical protein
MRGDKFNRLTVIGYSHSKPKKDGYFHFLKCSCDCGNETVARIDSLKSGHKSSCGCFHIETARKVNFKHGKYLSTEHRIWAAMKDRCSNPNNDNYKYYGARGISVCEEWKNSFESFYRDMGPRPPGKTIDREDNNGNYCKKNCRWATPKQQRLNQRNPYEAYPKRMV